MGTELQGSGNKIQVTSGYRASWSNIQGIGYYITSRSKEQLSGHKWVQSLKEEGAKFRAQKGTEPQGAGSNIQGTEPHGADGSNIQNKVVNRTSKSR